MFEEGVRSHLVFKPYFREKISPKFGLHFTTTLLCRTASNTAYPGPREGPLECWQRHLAVPNTTVPVAMALTGDSVLGLEYSKSRVVSSAIWLDRINS